MCVCIFMLGCDTHTVGGWQSKVFCEYERSKLVLPTPPSPTATHLMTLSHFAMPSTCGDTSKLCSVDPISSI